MSRIQQLPSSVITKIAAGEVIERPASVVKEMLENSIDAGSRRIEVDVEQGGAELIRIVDDGHGIHPDDFPLIFSNHATSKLSNADDLFSVRTLGFRGEALASIGGVAQVRIQSRLEGEFQGAEIRCHGGNLTAVLPWSGSQGTRIEVKHLFFNTPVRKKFLKTTTTEMGHITEAFTRLALAHPEIHLILRHNDRLLYELPSGKDRFSPETIRSRIRKLFGKDVEEKLYELEATQGTTTLRGFIADPTCERGSAKMQYLFVNGRYVRDRTVTHALQEAYRGLLMTGRYAVAFLFLDLPADQLDVNVHPTKSEVRFVNSQPVHRLVQSALKERLNLENLTARLQPPPESVVESSMPTPGESIPFSAQESPPREWPQPEELPSSESLSKVIQLYNAYLVMETPEGMLVIDQHALHERILFEKIKARIQEGSLEKQQLLIPEPVELSPEQASKALEHRDALRDLGLEIDAFGGSTILVTAFPAIMQKRAPSEILKAVVDHLMTEERAPTREVLLNDLMSLMACHSAVRAGDRLSTEQMLSLIAQRDLADDTHHCPHGRPTALLFTRQELDRQFRRA